MKGSDLYSLLEAEMRPNTWMGEARITGYEHQQYGPGHFHVLGGFVTWISDGGGQIRLAEYGLRNGSLASFDLRLGPQALEDICAAGEDGEIQDPRKVWDEDPFELSGLF
jgi:hypothetical protein